MLQPTLHLRDLRHPGQAQGRFELTRSPIRIGRGPRCEIRLHSEEIADVQVILRRDGNRWLIHPVGPAEGCLFNGEALAETQNLLLGTTFTIGHVELLMGDAQAVARPGVAEITPVAESPAVAVVPAPAAAHVAEAVPEPARPVLAEAPKPTLTATPRPTLALAPTTGLEFEQTGLLADLAHRALEKGQRRQQIPTLATPWAASSAADLSQPMGEMPIGRAMPNLNTKRPASTTGTSAAASLSDWAEEFSRRYRTGQLPARQAETPVPDSPAYAPRPLPTFHKLLHSADHGTPFLDHVPPPARPVASVAAVAKAEQEPADFPSVIMQLHPSDAVQTHQECFHETESAFHDVQLTTDYETGTDLEPVLDDELSADSALVECCGAAEIDEFPEPVVVVADTPVYDFVAQSLYLPEDEPVAPEPPVAVLPVQLSEAMSPEKFEEWISTVGSILGTLDPETPGFEAIQATGTDDDAFDACDFEAEAELDMELEDGSSSAEIDIEIADYPLGDIPAEPQPQVIEAVATAVPLAAEISAVSETEAEALEQDEDLPEPESDGQWPSVQDIMRWSAVRDAELGDDANMQAAGQAEEDHEIAPRQLMRVNLPVAGMICLAWLGFSGVMVWASMRIGLQDETTQKAISAINTATLNNSTPRLSAGLIQKISTVPAWWSITGDQIWWRATFLKMREQGGQATPVPGDTLAEKALANSPLLPQGRLWNASRQQAASPRGQDWAGLSRDVISLVVSADHFRRIGDDDKANAADRQALELVTAPDRILIDRKVQFDAELGTGRFLLPNQKDVVEILKRLAKEPNAAELIAKVMPEDRPLVWLTAAQYLKQAGLGDPEPELTRILAWATPSRASLDQRRVDEAIRAEALAMQGKTVDAAEIYMRLTQTTPDSVWKRAWYFNHGDLSQRNQKTDAALVSWRKARGDDPNHEVDRHAIQASRSLTSTTSGSADSSRNNIRTN